MSDRAASLRIALDGAPREAAWQCRELDRRSELRSRASPWRRLALALAALAAGAGALSLDRREPGSFSPLGPLALAALVLCTVALLRRRDPTAPSPSRASRIVLGLLLAVMAVTFVVLAAPLLEAAPAARTPWRYPVLALLALLAGWAANDLREAKASARPEADGRPATVAELLEALADDVAPGAGVTGWLDLTGARQPSKLVRRAKTAGGVAVALYQDEWLRLALPLRDGSRLRIAGFERVKDRAGRWKRGRSGKSKWRAGRQDREHAYRLRLAFDPRRYRARGPAQAPAKAGELLVSGLETAEGRLSAQVSSPSADVAPGDLLVALAYLHRHLEPAGDGR